MPHSLAILIALAVVLGTIIVVFFLLDGSPRVSEVDDPQNVDAPIDNDLQTILHLEAENANLREQIEVLEQMVETLNAEIEEINAVMDRPGSS